MANAGSQLWPGGGSERSNVSNFSASKSQVCSLLGIFHRHGWCQTQPWSGVAEQTTFFLSCCTVLLCRASHPSEHGEMVGAQQTSSPPQTAWVSSQATLLSPPETKMPCSSVTCCAQLPWGHWGVAEDSRRGLGAMFHGAAPWHLSSPLTPALPRQGLSVITFEYHFYYFLMLLKWEGWDASIQMSWGLWAFCCLLRFTESYFLANRWKVFGLLNILSLLFSTS